MAIQAAEPGGGVAVEHQIIRDVLQDTNAAWDPCKPQVVAENTSVAVSLKIRLVVRRSAKSARNRGEVQLENVL